MRFIVVLGLLLSVEVSAGSILITNAALHTCAMMQYSPTPIF